MRLGLIIPEERKQREEVHSEIGGEGGLSLFFMSHRDILASDLISQRLRAVFTVSQAFEWTSGGKKGGQDKFSTEESRTQREIVS